jgi:hypothetical protein
MFLIEIAYNYNERQEQYPVELIKKLKRSDSVIEEKFPGIYYISGNTMFPTQLIITRKLSKKGHSSLRVLSAQVQREDIQNFLTDSEQLTEQGDRGNIDALLQVSVAANTSAYDEIRKESRHMCKAIEELFKDEIDKKVMEGKIETLIALVKDNLITISEAAKRADMTEAVFTEKMAHFGK